jgi:hypothetical protein
MKKIMIPGLMVLNHYPVITLGDLEMRYVRNSEQLALQGQPQPDGSWKYVEPNGCVHTMTAERAQAFMQQTHEHANIMCTMLDRLREAGLMDNIVDTEAKAA